MLIWLAIQFFITPEWLGVQQQTEKIYESDFFARKFPSLSFKRHDTYLNCASALLSLSFLEGVPLSPAIARLLFLLFYAVSQPFS